MNFRVSIDAVPWWLVAGSVYIGGLFLLVLLSRGSGVWADSVTYTVLCLGVIFAVTSPTAAVSVALVIGLSCGAIRRILEYTYPGGILTSYWVLLPSLLILLTFIASRYNNTRLTRGVPRFWTIAVVALIIAGVSPFGSGFVVNMLASCILIVSLLCFLLGRARVVAFAPIVGMVLFVGLVNSTMMVAQSVYGLTEWDKNWVATKGYAALYMGPGIVRPLGIASSAAESSALCAVTVILAAAAFRFWPNALRPIWITVISLSLWALLISGTRSFLILCVLGLCLLFVAGSARPWRNFFLLISAAAPLVVLVSMRLLPRTDSVGATRTLTTLSGQEDMETSTIPIHWELMWAGIRRGLLSVTGTGSGQLSVIGTNGGSAEIDLANLPLMAGIMGMVAVFALYWAFTKRIRRVLRLRSAAVMGALVLVVVAGQWFAVGHYGLTPLLWLAFGQLDDAVEIGGNSELDSDR